MFVSLFCFLGHDVQRYFLTLNSGITTNGVLGTYGMLGIDRWSAVCKVNTLASALALTPKMFLRRSFYRGCEFLKTILKYSALRIRGIVQ